MVACAFLPDSSGMSNNISPDTGGALVALRALPRTVWALGFVSLFMDLSSEMIHALLPLFLIGTLHATTTLVGLIEGVGEATAAFAKVFSGTLSDVIGRRKPIVLLGYGLSALSKPLFPLAASSLTVLVARFADRVGKGLRGAPRDALIADITQPAERGAAFGLRQGLDSLGAVLGPLAALGLMLLLGDMRSVFWWASLPAALTVLVLFIGVEEPEQPPGTGTAPMHWSRLFTLGPAVWRVILLGAAFSLARLSEAFLVLKAVDAGLAPALAPLGMITMNAVYALLSAPAGALSDRIGPARILALGLSMLVLADFLLAFAHDPISLLAGASFWGLFMGLSQGVLSALLADAAPKDLRGTAFGLFYLVTGVVLLLGGVLAGALWQYVKPGASFLAGAIFALLALFMLLTQRRDSGASKI